MLDVDAHPREELPHLAHGMHRDAVALELLQIAAPRWGQRVVSPAVGALKGAVCPGEWPRDHAADGVLAGHLIADPPADGIQGVGGDDVDVGRDLKHRVLAGVDDEPAVGDVLGAEVLDRLQAVVRTVADHLPAAGGTDDLDHLGGEAVGIGRRPAGSGDAHQPPVPGGRVLAGAERRQAPVHHGLRRRRQSGQREDRAQPQPPQRGQFEAAEMLGEVGQGVGTGVAVLGGVRGGAHAAGVEHDDERAPHRPLTALAPVRTR